eukprot:202909_1
MSPLFQHFLVNLLFCYSLAHDHSADKNKPLHDECDARAKQTISDIYVGTILEANRLFLTDSPDGMTDYMAQHCSDDFVYDATLYDDANVKIVQFVWNNLDEYLYSGNAYLTPHPQMLVDGTTRRTITISPFSFECVGKDDDRYDEYQIVAQSYYAVRIVKKSTLEADVVVNYVATYWKYSQSEKRWLWAKAIYETKNPFVAGPSQAHSDLASLINPSAIAPNSSTVTHDNFVLGLNLTIVSLLIAIFTFMCYAHCVSPKKQYMPAQMMSE